VLKKVMTKQAQFEHFFLALLQRSALPVSSKVNMYWLQQLSLYTDYLAALLFAISLNKPCVPCALTSSLCLLPCAKQVLL
jgi:hypothetical protein